MDTKKINVKPGDQQTYPGGKPIEQPAVRWQKLSMAFGAILLMLVGLIFLNYSGLSDEKFAQLVDGLKAFFSAVGYIAIAYIAGNLGEHWKGAISTFAQKIAGSKK